jgi:hypothetical protein
MCRMVMRSFQGDCREAHVISDSYGMGDHQPRLSRHSFNEGGREVEGKSEGEASPGRNYMKYPGQEARNRGKNFITIPSMFI